MKMLNKGLLVSWAVAWMICFSCSFTAIAADKDRPPVLPAGTIPERIILTWNSDPATTQAVTWRTEKPCEKSHAQIAIAASDPNIEIKAVSVNSDNQEVKCENGSMVYYHTAVFQNLSPATLYCYRVGDGVAYSEWNQFKTANTSNKPFKFIYLGDQQNNIKMYCSRVIRRAFAAAPDAAFIVHAGDLVGLGDSDEQWTEWFDAAGWIYRTIPSLPVLGNHEQPDVNPEDHAAYSRFWQPQFALPSNGPADQKEYVYYLDYQGVRFIALNGTKLLDQQAKWLEPLLANNPCRWTIIVMHQPMFPTAKTRDGLETQAAFKNLFDQYRVDLVLQGHDHMYTRTHKIFAGKAVANDQDGTVYCTSVVGPKQYTFNPLYVGLMSNTGSNRQLFQVISINNDRLSYNSFTVTGEVFDTFEIKKIPDKGNLLIEP